MIHYTFKQKLKKIMNIALPSGANSFLDIFVIAISMFFMGKLSSEHIVAVGVGLNFFMLFYTINAIFYIGTNAQISRFFGAKDKKNSNLVFSTLLIGSFFVCIPMVGIAIWGYPKFLDWISMGVEARRLGEIYLKIVIYSLPAMFLKNIMISALAAIGDTITPFLMRVFTTSFCILLNYVLIFGKFGFPRLEIVGAAYSNVIIAYLELAILFGLMFRKKAYLSFCFKFCFKFFRNALRIGIPAGLERLLTLFSLVLTTKFLSEYGDNVLAGSQIGTRIEAFSFMPGFGFMVAAMALVGQSLGANRVDIASDFVKTILKISSFIMGILGLVMAIFAGFFSSIFATGEEVIHVSKMYLLAVGLSQIPLIWVFVLDGALRGAGITKISLCINAVSIWVFRILPMWVLLYLGFGVKWIFVMIFIETYIRAIIFWVVFSKGTWKRPGKTI
ncbi:MATE family efflux transporter [Helicobacter cappadocius]|uniref:Multidrug-efflux transporter n=1 Tax=Helicobacter cappadocius TaxID=3063998 RepID=A0AA90PQP7_9HELI|nr:MULTISPECIES: MATE family efflux transporter [unclassified Helicobacter]MDO7253202.1 MATE family efflux transporter [Helicobacter sp. faydin-H75]MDP2539126.1 MATE family efflux transporter [Helicobacter sp. faydin-H76]